MTNAIDTSINVTPTTSQNFLAGNRAVLTIAQVKGFEYNCQDFNLPGINSNPAIQSSPFVNINHPGDKPIFDQLNVMFLVDENLKNWIAMFNWISSLTFPQDWSQYKQRKFTTSDATIHLFSNNQNPVAIANFKNVFPIGMSGVDFSMQDAETMARQTQVSFIYDYYTIEVIE